MSRVRRRQPSHTDAHLDESFFSRPAEIVARDLIGKILVRQLRTRQLRGRIVETEAYVGPHDLACHAAKGRTRRTEVMFGPAGRAYVYFIYGMYEMLNIVTGVEGDAQAVLVRAAEPLDGWDENVTGPGRLARGFRIKLSENGLDLTSSPKLFVAVADSTSPPPRIVRTPRVGVDYAKHWKDELLRFVDANSAAVSKPRPPLAPRNK
jgi:DNA-3-methyladenine glycosylase